MKRICLIFIFSLIWSQPESWSFNPADYEHQMSVTAIILGDDFFHHPENILGAFNEQDECVGQAGSTATPFGPYEGEEAFIIQIYSNAFSGGETNSFKIYIAETEKIFLIENTTEFVQDGVLGSVVSPLLFVLNEIEEEQPEDPEEGAAYTDENNDGYDDTSFAAGVASVDANSDGIVDEFPNIFIIDGNAIVLIQGSLDQYTDSGATCSDQEDGDIAQNVEVSGQIVNMNIPGTYIVSYNCSDSDGNTAQTQNRTVFVTPPAIEDINEDGFDDDAFMEGAQSGDANLDGILNVIDIVIYISSILNGE